MKEPHAKLRQAYHQNQRHLVSTGGLQNRRLARSVFLRYGSTAFSSTILTGCAFPPNFYHNTSANVSSLPINSPSIPPHALPLRVSLHTGSHTSQCPVITGRGLGIHSAGRTEEENITYEETAQVYGWKGIEGRDESQPVLGLWQCEKSASAMSILC